MQDAVLKCATIQHSLPLTFCLYLCSLEYSFFCTYWQRQHGMNSCASMAFCHVSSGMSTWIVAKNLWCKRGGTFKNLRQAQAACLTLGSNCHGVYDDGCDGHGELHVCKTSSVLNPSSRSCVYMPTTVSSSVLKPASSAALKGAVRTYLQASPTCMNIGRFVS